MREATSMPGSVVPPRSLTLRGGNCANLAASTTRREMWPKGTVRPRISSGAEWPGQRRSFSS
eukprot:6750852-Prorocentrum_lima.AAC.1